MFNFSQTHGEALAESLLNSGGPKLKQNKSTDFWRDYYLAGEATTPAVDLVALAEHSDSIIRKRVAENLFIPSYVQKLLVSDKNSDVKLALATNPSTLVEIWQQLAKDDDELVRHSLASNKNLPVPLLIRLISDTDANVAAQAQLTIERIFGSRRSSAA